MGLDALTAQGGALDFEQLLAAALGVVAPATAAQPEQPFGEQQVDDGGHVDDERGAAGERQPGLPLEAWRLYLCRFRLDAGSVLVVDGGHHGRRAVPPGLVVELLAPRDDYRPCLGLGREVVAGQDLMLELPHWTGASPLPVVPSAPVPAADLQPGVAGSGHVTAWQLDPATREARARAGGGARPRLWPWDLPPIRQPMWPSADSSSSSVAPWAYLGRSRPLAPVSRRRPRR